MCGLGWCCVVQHPPVYTVGKRATFHNIKASTEVRKTTADSRPEPEPSAQIVHYVVPGDSPAWHTCTCRHMNEPLDADSLASPTRSIPFSSLAPHLVDLRKVGAKRVSVWVLRGA